MVSSWMPDVVVEIAFNSGYTTPAASRTWTDVSTYVELADRIAIGFGRQDERSTADANSLSLTLDNTDGRFTALRAASPYYPNVKIGRPIRVTVTPPGGTASTRFVGFIDEWPVEWDGTDSYARAQIRASSRLARLGLSAKLRSMPEAAILASQPAGYWTLGDSAGSTAAVDSSGRGAPSLAVTDLVGSSPALTFGTSTGAITDGLTAVECADGQYLKATTGGVARGFHVTFQTTTVSNGLMDFGTLNLEITSTGLLRANLATGGAGFIASAAPVTDGQIHDATLTYTPSGTCYLSLDGVLQGTGTGGSTDPSGDLRVGLNFIGTIAHVAFWDDSGSTPDAVTIAAAVLGTSQRTDERLVSLLDWAGVAATEVTTDTGSETMTYQQTSGQSVVDALRDVESTEGGVLFDDRDGNVRFHNRSHRYLATAAATLNMAAQHVGADYAPKLDRSTLLNDVEVSNPTTGEKARSLSTTSSDEYGVATGTATSVASTYDPLQQKASWMIASYAEPRNRVPSLTVDVLAHQGLTPSAQTLLGITVGDLLAVTNAPTQADTTSPSYFVEGYTESIGPESYEITFNLSPTYPTLNTLVLDSAIRGLLDTGVLAL